MVHAGANERSSSAVALHSFNDMREIICLDDKDKFFYYLYAPPVITGCLRAAYVTGAQQVLLNQLAQIVCPIQQHGVGFGRQRRIERRHPDGNSGVSAHFDKIDRGSRFRPAFRRFHSQGLFVRRVGRQKQRAVPPHDEGDDVVGSDGDRFQVS